MTDVPWIDWYQSLAKPSWTPAPQTIGLIWQILYPALIATCGYVFVQAARGRLPLATVDILVVWGTIVWMMLSIWPHARLVAAAAHYELVPRGTEL
jgi:tryptophan-rich sensory protein